MDHKFIHPIETRYRTEIAKLFTEDKKTATDDKDINRNDTKNKGKPPIKKNEDTKKTEKDTETKGKLKRSNKIKYS